MGFIGQTRLLKSILGATLLLCVAAINQTFADNHSPKDSKELLELAFLKSFFCSFKLDGLSKLQREANKEFVGHDLNKLRDAGTQYWRTFRPISFRPNGTRSEDVELLAATDYFGSFDRQCKVEGFEGLSYLVKVGFFAREGFVNKIWVHYDTGQIDFDGPISSGRAPQNVEDVEHFINLYRTSKIPFDQNYFRFWQYARFAAIQEIKSRNLDQKAFLEFIRDSGFELQQICSNNKLVNLHIVSVGKQEIQLEDMLGGRNKETEFIISFNKSGLLKVPTSNSVASADWLLPNYEKEYNCKTNLD